MTSERLSSDARASLAKVLAQYSQALANSPGCLSYLAERGVWVEPELFEFGEGNEFGLGFVDHALMPEHEGKVGSLVIPYWTKSGPVGAKFRMLDGSHPKYKAHTGMGTRLYNVPAIDVDSPVVAITEGELDTIVLSQQLAVPSVAVPGVNGWRSDWRFCFEGYERVIVFGDGDDPGRDFTRRLANEVSNARPVHMPDGHDVSSYVTQFGADAMRKRANL